jgi:hercynine metabolism protein
VSSSWFEQLEAQLERQLEAFLQANPAQEALVQEQEQQERQQRLKRQRLDLQAQAEHTRAGLLQLASDIAQWQQRLQRAQAAGATDLAQRAEAHVHQLMAQGRDRWQALGDLGHQFHQVDEELEQLAQARPAPPRAASADLEPDLNQAWAAFEAAQELERLRRAQGPGS